MKLFLHFKRAFSSVKIVPIKGSTYTNQGPAYQENTNNVKLRGVKLESTCKDMPNFIFLPNMVDPIENWINFFTNPDHDVDLIIQLITHRNIYLVYPRNFGTSDRNIEFGMEEQANDVLRFMYENKISTACVGGHGIGGKIALAMGCFHGKYVTGYVGLDSAPTDHRFFEPFQDVKKFINFAKSVNLNRPLKDIELDLKKGIYDVAWRKKFIQNLKEKPSGGFQWNFEINFIDKNLQYNQADSLGAWNFTNGLFTGRSTFIFPEYSRWVHLNTNTLAMHKICVQLHGMNKDIWPVQSDEDPKSLFIHSDHFFYDNPDLAKVIASKTANFFRNYDGVHTLLADRSEVGRYFIPDRSNARNIPDHIPSDYSPTHLYHNWRFKDVYKKEEKAEN